MRLDRIVVVNVGSSSLKLRLLDADDRLLDHEEAGQGANQDDALAAFLDRAGDIDAIGHRVVHGGTELVNPTVLDDNAEDRLEALSELAETCVTVPAEPPE